ncbi:hypothetical protein BASA81_001345 [Batrachochytrium salamandrivorans]|nr:hypothetical protein BASA81_001345 [Batrachochytrium salamandrivorans]
MVGFAVECVRRGNGHGVEMTRLSLPPIQVCIPNSHMPMAPAEALFLDSSSFEVYNANVNSKAKLPADAVPREHIDFENDATVLQGREGLISNIILPAIFSSEEGGAGAFQAFEAWFGPTEVDGVPSRICRARCACCRGGCTRVFCAVWNATG